MKGQVFEMLGFLILAIAIIGIIILIRTYLVGGYGKTFITLVERHELEGFKAGVNSVFYTTEKKTGRKLSELLGIVAYTGEKEIDFGPVIGKVDVIKELEWRFDALYGKGKWYIKIPPPEIIPYIQVVIIVDTSASLCDDIEDMKNNLPKIIEDLRDKYNIFATLYMLPGGQECCDHKSFKLSCKTTQFPETSYFHCRDISRVRCSNKPKNEEDWGRGLACAIEAGPIEGWFQNSTKIGIILSDELPGGSEDKGGNQNKNSLKIGIQSAKNFNMTVFPIKTSTGKACCPSCENCPDECKICMMWWDENWNWVKTWIFTEIQCKYDDLLTQYMKEIAEETGGKMYSLENSNEVTKSIENILTTLELSKKPKEVGTSRLPHKNIKAVTVPIPVTLIGEYTNAFVYQWS